MRLRRVERYVSRNDHHAFHEDAKPGVRYQTFEFLEAIRDRLARHHGRHRVSALGKIIGPTVTPTLGSQERHEPECLPDEPPSRASVGRRVVREVHLVGAIHGHHVDLGVPDEGNLRSHEDGN